MNEAVISRIADAIAFAEGYYQAGSRPHRNNNPGDLERDFTGKSIGRDGPYVVYRCPEDGWEALRSQVRLMFQGSRIYNRFMTIAEVGSHYTATGSKVWSENVARRLGATVDTRLGSLTGDTEISSTK